MNEEDKKIKERLMTIFPSPVVASRVVDMVVHHRPVGWGRKSNAPYYKEVYAKQVKSDVDRMIEKGTSIVYRYSIWCTDQTNMSPGTLYNRVNQSIRYLCEQMDPTGAYRKWYETVHLTREKGLGIVIEFIAGLANEGEQMFKADEIAPRTNVPRWRAELDKYLEDDKSKQPFVAENLALNPDEIAELKIQLSQLTNVIASVTSISIKVLKTH